MTSDAARHYKFALTVHGLPNNLMWQGEPYLYSYNQFLWTQQSDRSISITFLSSSECAECGQAAMKGDYLCHICRMTITQLVP